ncbi:MAG TPA: LysE family transporter [Longimicrobiales bacterium]|nr:LysE family transporter [Longimicrobiales bacterium]
MLQSILFAGGYAFAAGIQPGPLQAFLLSRTFAHGWKRTLPAALAPLLSDGPIALVVLLVVGQLSPRAQQGLRMAGGVLLLYLAWAAFRQTRNDAEPEQAGSAPRTLFQAVLVNLLNPNAYLGWAFILGPALLTAWHRQPAQGIALLVTFYGVLVTTTAAFVVLAGTARFLSEQAQRALLGVSALVLAGLGVYLLVTAGSR